MAFWATKMIIVELSTDHLLVTSFLISGAVVGVRAVCFRTFHLPISRRYRRETSQTNWHFFSSGGTLRPWMWLRFNWYVFDIGVRVELREHIMGNGVFYKVGISHFWIRHPSKHRCTNFQVENPLSSSWNELDNSENFKIRSVAPCTRG